MPTSLENLLFDPKLAVGLQLLNRRQSDPEALINALTAGQQSVGFQKQFQQQEEEFGLRKSEQELQNRQIQEEIEQKELLRRLFGDTTLDLEKISNQLMKTGDKALIKLATQIKPKVVDPKLQTIPIGAESVTGTFDPKLRKFDPLFVAPRHRPERPRAVGAVKKDKPVKKEVIADNLNKDAVLYNKIGKDEFGLPLVSRKEFLGRADVLRAAEKAAGRKVSSVEKMEFLTGTPEQFENVLRSLNIQVQPPPVEPQFSGSEALNPEQQLKLKTLSEGIFGVQPEEVEPQVSGLETLNLEQQRKLKTILESPNISPEKKLDILKQLGLQ